ncbi:hypothetical protein MLD38_012430 [Melastoma candidum]|uniref:Uncharacterized protein n=2 Tax=Melastoma candidum TaxID=119954 RepID=A0ACB9R6W1_9MYRT|nr:hypothetical protein MLD38_012430 [Melastoma candidum]
MPENPFASASATDASSAVRRYSPPNQRNRLNRRKSGEQLDRSSSLSASDSEKNFTVSSRYVLNDHRDAGNNNFLMEPPPSRLVYLEGCCSSEAHRLLNDRWAAAMHCYNDPNIDLFERPVMYTGSSASAWGQAKLPHQLLSPGGNPQMDFLAELRLAMMHNANAGI